MSKTKTLILIRHAHRDVIDPTKDNGLSDKGKQQAKKISRYFLKDLDSKNSVRFFSSPKKRCKETIEDLVKKVDSKVQVDDRLIETGPFEAYAEVRARLNSFVNDWKTAPEQIWVACSHGDIIPTLIHQYFGIVITLKKAGYVAIEFEPTDHNKASVGSMNSELKITWICQKIPELE